MLGTRAAKTEMDEVAYLQPLRPALRPLRGHPQRGHHSINCQVPGPVWLKVTRGGNRNLLANFVLAVDLQRNFFGDCDSRRGSVGESTRRDGCRRVIRRHDRRAPLDCPSNPIPASFRGRIIRDRDPGQGARSDHARNRACGCVRVVFRPQGALRPSQCNADLAMPQITYGQSPARALAGGRSYHKHSRISKAFARNGGRRSLSSLRQFFNAS
jgi:hypothetical protein